MVRIPVLAKKLVQIQATIIIKCLPDIVRKINDKLSNNKEQLNRLPQSLTSVAVAMASFMHVLRCCKEFLRKILVRGEFDEYIESMEMHCSARLTEMLDSFSDELQSNCTENYQKGNFLLDEIQILEEARAISLPNFLPRAAFLILLKKKIRRVKAMPFDSIDKVWNYIATVVVKVLKQHSDVYPQLVSSTRRAAQALIAKKKKQSIDWVVDIMEMEKLNDYTCNPEYTATWNKLITRQGDFLNILKDHSKVPKIKIDGFGEIDVAHLCSRDSSIIQQGFDLKMRITAYWSIVLRRLVDSMALHLLFSIQNLVNKEMEMEIINEIMWPEGNGMQRMLEESPSVSEKRKRLKSSIELLEESKDGGQDYG